MGFLGCLFAGLVEDHLAAQAVLFQRRFGNAILAEVTGKIDAAFFLGIRQFQRPCHGPVVDRHGFHHFIHQTDFFRRLGFQLPTGEHQVQGGGDTHQTRHALGAAAGGQQAQHHFRQAQYGIAAAGGDTVGAGQRQLHAAAQAGTLDGGHYRDIQVFQFLERMLAQYGQVAHFLGGLGVFKQLDIGAGHERACLGGVEHQGLGGGFFDVGKGRVEIVGELRFQGVLGIAGHIDFQYGHTVIQRFESKGTLCLAHGNLLVPLFIPLPAPWRHRCRRRRRRWSGPGRHRDAAVHTGPG